ncbi:MAG: molybdopterin-containing oxidoreductase family protein [Lachnospiraceae bacterium]|jgi:anaerobic selenocysteine-containing dehydrogenase
MKEKKVSICGLCGNKCAFEAEVTDGKLTKTGKLACHPVLPTNICVRGAALKQSLHHKNRLHHPMKRVEKDGQVTYERVSWEEAIGAIADRLIKTRDESGAKSTVFFCGHPKGFRRPLAKLAANFGTPNFCTESSTCHSAMTMAWKLIYGGSDFRPDTANSDVYVIWSNNPAGGNGDNTSITELKERGVKIILVDPHITATANVADLHLQLHPGTDGALALGIANVIISRGLEDRDYIEKYTVGFEEYKEYVKEFTPERVEAVTGIPARRIIEAAKIIANGKTSLKCSSCAILHCINGVQNLRAAGLLLALTGNIGTPGGIMPAAEPVATLDTFHHNLFDRPDLENDISAGEFPVWNELVNNEAQCVNHLANAVLEGRPYRVRNLITFAMNTGMFPRPDKMVRAMEEVEFSVAVDFFWTDACKAADYVLPACMSPELDQVQVGKGNRLIYVEHVIEPGDKLPDVEIILRLAHAMGVHGEMLDLADYEAYMNYSMRKLGVTLDELKAAPEGIEARCASQPKPFNIEDGFATPSGKIEFVSGVMKKYEHLTGHDALPKFRDWRDELPEYKDYTFTLVTGPRKAYYFHSRTFRLAWIDSLEKHTCVAICPEDADRIGVEDGGRVRLITPVGSMEYYAFVDSGLKSGVAYVYHSDGKQNVNLLLQDGIYDPVSGFPNYRSYVCNIEKV